MSNQVRDGIDAFLGRVEEIISRRDLLREPYHTIEIQRFAIVVTRQALQQRSLDPLYQWAASHDKQDPNASYLRRFH